jgi:hypothetical protein
MERCWPLPPVLAPLRILSTAGLRTTIAQKRNAGSTQPANSKMIASNFVSSREIHEQHRN